MSLFGTQNAIERLQTRLAAVEDLCANLERQNRKLGLEYVELYDKVMHQMSRMAKRYAVREKELNDEAVVETPVDDPAAASAAILRGRSFLRG